MEGDLGDEAWGTNLIEKILDGRVVREDFDGRPGTSLRGVRLSAYDEEDGVWQQAWGRTRRTASSRRRRSP